MTWDIRADSWADFPLNQKWFATGEALAHLEYLVEEGAVVRALEPGGYGPLYQPVKQGEEPPARLHTAPGAFCLREG